VIHSGNIVLLDFDGTVVTGPGPVLAYARQAAANLTGAAGGRLVAQVETGLAQLPDVDGAVPLDGYDLVRILAIRAGLRPEALDAAYLASRHLLAGPQAPVRAPDGLGELLVELRRSATVVLVTNAPDIRLHTALDHLGLGDRFDEVLTSAGKPATLPALLDRFEAEHPADLRVLSIGDVWANDLAPVHARGYTTALVGHVPPGARPTFHAADLPSLYPALVGWTRSTGSERSAGPDLRPSTTLTTEGTR
jgi:FMN phosphatase YigB (HAD superfamily)